MWFSRFCPGRWGKPRRVSVAEEPSKPQEVNGKREPKPRRCRRRKSNPVQSWPVQVQYERLNRLYVWLKQLSLSLIFTNKLCQPACSTLRQPLYYTVIQINHGSRPVARLSSISASLWFKDSDRGVCKCVLPSSACVVQEITSCEALGIATWAEIWTIPVRSYVHWSNAQAGVFATHQVLLGTCYHCLLTSNVIK